MDSGDQFSPLRTGLDHIASAVSDDDELTAWIAHLEGLEVGHSPTCELGHPRFVSREDPDGIQIELRLSIVPHRPGPARFGGRRS